MEDHLHQDIVTCEAHFGSSSGWSWAVAPGRVNLIGEHTDYHDGWVLPAAIDKQVRAVARPRADQIVRVYSEVFDKEHSFSLADSMTAEGGWGRRAEGITREILESAGEATGMDLWIGGDLPIGGGLSSSAASMAVIGMLVAELHQLPLDPREFARTLQQAEHRHAGLQCGIMDQLAVLLGEQHSALLIDCRSLETTTVRIPREWAIVIADSGVHHDLASSGYNQRRGESMAALDVLRRHRGEIRALRDATWADLEAAAGDLTEIGYRRCRHVIAENERVRSLAKALESADSTAAGTLMAASHVSLRDDYEVSCPEVDQLVEDADDGPGCIGARMTGGGFGGSAVNLVERNRVDEFTAHLAGAFRKRTGQECEMIVTSAAAGATAGFGLQTSDSR